MLEGGFSWQELYLVSVSFVQGQHLVMLCLSDFFRTKCLDGEIFNPDKVRELSRKYGEQHKDEKKTYNIIQSRSIKNIVRGR